MDHEPAPHAPEQHDPPRTLGTVPALALALVVSILANAVVAVRLREAQDEARAARRELQEVHEELEGLRRTLRGPAAGTENDPIAALAAAVERLRGLKFRRKVEPELLSPARLRSRVRSIFERDTSRAEVEASEKVLKALGLLRADASFYEMLADVHEEQVAGFYDSDAEELVVRASDARDPTPFDRVILAHELTHALTDQRFDLDRLDGLEDADDEDAAAAFQALTEGDAMLVMQLYQQQVLTPEEQLRLLAEARAAPRDTLTTLPPFLREVLEMPYTRGVDFVKALHDRGGFALVDEAYRDPPVSTEQILHPSKYVDQRDDPTPVVLGNVARALGSGWRVIERGTVGEFDMRLILDELLEAGDARAGAAGWDGGRYVGVEGPSGVVVATRTAWDSDREAGEAADRLRRWLPRRYPQGTSFGGGSGWGSDEGAGLVTREGRAVVFVVAPNVRIAERAAAAA